MKTPIQQKGMLQCILRRKKNLFGNEYTLHTEWDNNFLMMATKKMNGSYDLFWKPGEVAKKGGFYIGKMIRQNYKYYFYDDGKSPQSKSIVRANRVELGNLILNPIQTAFADRKVHLKDYSGVLTINKPKQSKNGGFFLNFNGRVKLASIKNF